MFKIRHLLPLAALAAVLSYAEQSSAETIIDEWQSVKAPPAPQLKSVTLDPKRPSTNPEGQGDYNPPFGWYRVA